MPLRIRIFDIPNDTGFLVIDYMTLFDFLSLSQTCSHFYKLSDPIKYPAINKYCQKKCQQFWSLIEKSNYTTENSKFLLQSMIDFVVCTFGDMLKEKRHKMISKSKILQRVRNMKITVDRLSSESNVADILSYIIKQDKLEMFKIYLNGNMIDNPNYINKRIDNFPQAHSSSPILYVVAQFGAIKIARYLLAPIVIKNEDEDEKINDDINNIKNTRDSEICHMQYNFANIDIHKPAGGLFSSTDTPLLCASQNGHVEIVSLLINHPSMNEKGINQASSTGVTPLHAISLVSYWSKHKVPYDNAMKIAKLLMNDKRTNINAVDIGHTTALESAIQCQPKVALLFIENDKIDVNIQSGLGNTALHAAANNYEIQLQQPDDIYLADTVEAAKKLLQRKDIDINIKNLHDQTALDLAKKNHFSKMVDLFNQ